MPLHRLVSGGQTGVDRAALDAALESDGVEVGGWCPRGRRAEDGRIADRYPLDETPSDAYAQRTEWNVRDSDATLIFTRGPVTGGTALTLDLAEQQGRPHRVVDLSGEASADRIAEEVADWIRVESVEVLNVAGPREGGAPGIYDHVRPLVRAVLDRV